MSISLNLGTACCRTCYCYTVKTLKVVRLDVSIVRPFSGIRFSIFKIQTTIVLLRVDVLILSMFCYKQ